MKPKRQIFKEAILMQKLLDYKFTRKDERGDLCEIEGAERPTQAPPKPYVKPRRSWKWLFNSYKMMLP